MKNILGNEFEIGCFYVKPNSGTSISQNLLLCVGFSDKEKLICLSMELSTSYRYLIKGAVSKKTISDPIPMIKVNIEDLNTDITAYFLEHELVKSFLIKEKFKMM